MQKKNIKKIFLAALCLTLFFSGCAKLDVKDGEIPLGKDTSVTMDEFGVGAIKSKF